MVISSLSVHYWIKINNLFFLLSPQWVQYTDQDGTGYGASLIQENSPKRAVCTQLDNKKNFPREKF